MLKQKKKQDRRKVEAVRPFVYFDASNERNTAFPARAANKAKKIEAKAKPDVVDLPAWLAAEVVASGKARYLTTDLADVKG